jgi:serine/threonine protein kinase
MLRQFELRSIIGSGGMGTVYRAWDTTLERLVAVKLMKKELLEDPGAGKFLSRSPRLRPAEPHEHRPHLHVRRMGRAAVSRHGTGRPRQPRRAHRKIARCCPNWTCSTSASKSPPRSTWRSNTICSTATSSRATYLVQRRHEPKLIDFGLARKADAEQEVEDVTWGTPYYVAPEKIKREPETFLSDMYSLGATLYHALTGHVPFDAPTAEEVIVAQVQHAADAAEPGRAEITQPTSDALVKALAKNPARPLFELRRIHHGARSGAQPAAPATLKQPKEYLPATARQQKNLPRSFSQKFGDVLRQILRQQGECLPFRVRQIAADMNQRVAIHILIQQHPARGTFARGDVRGNNDPVILRGGNIGAGKTQPDPAVTDDDTRHHDIAGTPRGELISTVCLQLFAQRLRQHTAQPRLKGLIVEGQHFDGFLPPGPGIRVDRAQMITGTAGQQR